MRKPISSIGVPRQTPRLALAVATALVCLALAGTHTPAQGAGAAFGTCAAQQCPNGALVMTIALCWAVACVAFAGWISLRKPGPRQITPIMQACVLLAAFAAVSTGVWVAAASPTLIGDAGQPIRFR